MAPTQASRVSGRLAWGGGVLVIGAASGWIGAVLLGGPIGEASPSATALAGGAVACAISLIAAWRAPLHARRRLVTTYLLPLVPLTGVIVAMYVSDDVGHLVVRTSALGWVLAAGLPLAAAVAAYRAGGYRSGVDLAFGGAAGVGIAALWHVATADSTTPSSGPALASWPIDPWWAACGWVLGAVLAGVSTRLPPRPAMRLRLGVAWRSLPLGAAWLMAVITAVPAAPRHELATSAGAQVLALTLASGVLAVAGMLWWSERAPAGLGARDRFHRTLSPLAPRIATLSLFLIGGLQASSYSEVTMDDLGHFWIAADELANLRYPVWKGWLSLPSLPLLQLASFSVLGHTYPASLAPMFAANTLLPWLLYRAALALGAGRLSAFAVAVLGVVFPPIQVYSLGSAEPNALFIALLAATVWAFAHVLTTARPRQALVVFGGLAAVLTATRPEGPLYGGLMLLAVLVAIRSRWAVASGATFGVLLLPLVVYSLVQLGRPWRAFGAEYTFPALLEHAGVIGEFTWPRVGRVVLLNDVRFPLLIAAILGLFAIGAVRVSRRRWAFAVLPIAVVTNIVTALSIVDDMRIAHIRAEIVDEFIRHISHPTPIVAALAAVGITATSALTAGRPRLQAMTWVAGVAAAVYLAAGSLYVLGTPEEYFHGHNSGSLLAAHIYVNAPELWSHPFEIPRPEWDFVTVRRALFAWYEPFDEHGKTAGAAYQTLTGAVAATGFAALLGSAARRPATRRVTRRDDAA